MPYIIIENLNNHTLSTNDIAKNVLELILNNYIDWMHACGRKGRCTTCKMKVLKGADNLTPLTKFERQYLAANKLEQDERLACQAKLLGDILIRVPEDTKLPHLPYSN